MKKFKIKCFCKVNLCLRVIKKINKDYHLIKSFITFCDISDTITLSIRKSLKDKIIFSGRFKNGININTNTISKTLFLLRKIFALRMADLLRQWHKTIQKVYFYPKKSYHRICRSAPYSVCVKKGRPVLSNSPWPLHGAGHI